MAIDIECLGGNCPVQAERLIDGEPFYFRARGESWLLSVGRDFEAFSEATAIHGQDVVGAPRWFHEED
ncbi:MAG: hypothetical protein AAGH70_13960 [Pseudomonadota bacterium]